MTFQLPVRLIEKARDVVFFSPTLRIHRGCAIAPNSPGHGLAFDQKSFDEIEAWAQRQMLVSQEIKRSCLQADFYNRPPWRG
jgi:hypothetical protein